MWSWYKANICVCRKRNLLGTLLIQGYLDARVLSQRRHENITPYCVYKRWRPCFRDYKHLVCLRFKKHSFVQPCFFILLLSVHYVWAKHIKLSCCKISKQCCSTLSTNSTWSFWPEQNMIFSLQGIQLLLTEASESHFGFVWFCGNIEHPVICECESFPFFSIIDFSGDKFREYFAFLWCQSTKIKIKIK